MTFSPGAITYGDILEVNPFRNTVDIVEITGETILKALEYCASLWNPDIRHGGFLQFSGILSFCRSQVFCLSAVLRYIVFLQSSGTITFCNSQVHLFFCISQVHCFSAVLMYYFFLYFSDTISLCSFQVLFLSTVLGYIFFLQFSGMLSFCSFRVYCLSAGIIYFCILFLKCYLFQH